MNQSFLVIVYSPCIHTFLAPSSFFSSLNTTRFPFVFSSPHLPPHLFPLISQRLPVLSPTSSQFPVVPSFFHHVAPALVVLAQRPRTPVPRHPSSQWQQIHSLLMSLTDYELRRPELRGLKLETEMFGPAIRNCFPLVVGRKLRSLRASATAGQARLSAESERSRGQQHRGL